MARLAGHIVQVGVTLSRGYLSLCLFDIVDEFKQINVPANRYSNCGSQDRGPVVGFQLVFVQSGSVSAAAINPFLKLSSMLFARLACEEEHLHCIYIGPTSRRAPAGLPLLQGCRCHPSVSTYTSSLKHDEPLYLATAVPPRLRPAAADAERRSASRPSPPPPAALARWSTRPQSDARKEASPDPA